MFFGRFSSSVAAVVGVDILMRRRLMTGPNSAAVPGMKLSFFSFGVTAAAGKENRIRFTWFTWPRSKPEKFDNAVKVP